MKVKSQRRQDIEETIGKYVILSLLVIVIGIPIWNLIVCAMGITE
jgi:hypothetical protein